MATFTERLRRAWDIFTNPNEYNTLSDNDRYYDYGYLSTAKPDRVRFTRGNDRSIVNNIYNRIAADVSQIEIRHIKVDKEGQYVEDIKDSLNDCLTLSPNIDQTGKGLIQDSCMTMFDSGCVAIVPTKWDDNPEEPGAKKIYEMRVARVLEWRPYHVKVNIYNPNTGNKTDIWVKKEHCAIIENPLYSVMNEPNSALQRLIRKLNLMDRIDEQSASNKLNIIIQSPYPLKTKALEDKAENRRNSIEAQLLSSPHGIAYTDGTEKIVQLNRPLENGIKDSIKDLQNTVYSQIGITENILNGSADEQTNINYEQKTLGIILSAITDEMKRKFLTEGQRSNGHSIGFFRDPFKLVPMSTLAELADKFTRNEIMSPNEIRQKVGLKPSNDQQANELRNRNLNAGDGQQFASANNQGEANQQ